MTRLAAVIVDTYPAARLAHLAIERTVQTGLVSRVHTFSCAPIYPGEEFHRINPIRSTADYSHFMLNIVPHFIDADAVLVIQWDGMPGRSELWSDEFLQYDYIGAPWSLDDAGPAVGNGGFSLRSRRMLEALSDLKIRTDSAVRDGDVEDVVICRLHRDAFEERGCRFAPIALAARFSTENVVGEDSFGFHGVFNFPRFLKESDLLPLCSEICIRTGRDLFLANFMIACLRHGCADLYRAMLAALNSAGRSASIGGVCRSTGLHLPGFE